MSLPTASLNRGRIGESPGAFPLPRRGFSARFVGRVAVVVFLMSWSTGCALPQSGTRLSAVLDREGRRGWGGRDYRCTRGAHRGASEEYRENTLAALSAANADDRFEFIEFDVQYSKDGRIVVFHDRRMLRLFGSLRSIGNTTYEDLLRISRGEIAAYDEVMTLLDKKLNIEIKSQGNLLEDERLVDEVMADLHARGRAEDVLISSISSDVIRYVKLRHPAMPTGQVRWLTPSTYLHFDRLTRSLYEEIVDSRADYLMLHVANLRNLENLINLKPRGKTVVFWDFDDSMYLVHKDLADRLWGEGWWASLGHTVQYVLSNPLAGLLSGRKR